MSWSFSAQVRAEESPREKLSAVRAEVDPASSAAAYGARVETDEVIDAAIEAAASLILAVRGGLALNVHLSGHSNPGHQPVVGWSNELVNINVSQISA